jgi:Fic family protein
MHHAILALFDRRPYLTSKQVAYALGRPLNAISGRLSELLAMGELERTGARMDGAAVLRVRR